jgi:hypothetical protein
MWCWRRLEKTSWTDRERRNIAQSQGGKEYPTFNETSKIKRISFILHRICLLKHFIEGKLERSTEVAGR